MIISRDSLAAWVSRLVKIPSVNPVQAGPRAQIPGETRMAHEAAQLFTSLGAEEVVLDEVHPGRPNAYGIWRGNTDRWVAVDVHIDTVGVEQMLGDPFSGDIHSGKVWGRGAVDTKATLGTLMAIFEALGREGRRPGPNVVVAATVDEEVTGTGAPVFAAWLKKRGLPVTEIAVAEPTDCTPVHGHKGVARLELIFHGSSAHTSQPEMGVNAINAAARAIAAFEREHKRLQEESNNTKIGLPKLTVSLIQGGVGINLVPEQCRFSVDRRVVTGENPSAVLDELVAIARNASGVPLTATRIQCLPPFFQDPRTPWVKNLALWSGRTPTVAPYGTNAWAYADMPLQCVVIGPGSIDQSHRAEEWVAIDELEKICGVYRAWWDLAD